MTDWASHFTSAGPSKDDFQTDGTVAHEDIVCGRLLEELREDTLLAESIFGNPGSPAVRIERMNTRPPFDFRQMPRLQIYTESTATALAPTRLNVNEVRVFIGIRFDANPESFPVSRDDPYAAGPASVKRRVLEVVRRPAEDGPPPKPGMTSLPVFITLDGAANENEWVPVSMNLQSIDDLGLIYESTNAGDRTVGLIEIALVYRVDTEDATQRVQNLARGLQT